MIKPTDYPTASDFSECTVWRLDDEDDLYYPILTANDLPSDSSERDLSIRAVFKTPKGHSFDGYVVGIDRVFSLGLFGRERIFHLNRNLPDISTQQLKAYLDDNPDLSKLTAQDIFPLTYQTVINKEEFLDFSGSFDMEIEE